MRWLMNDFMWLFVPNSAEDLIDFVSQKEEIKLCILFKFSRNRNDPKAGDRLNRRYFFKLA